MTVGEAVWSTFWKANSDAIEQDIQLSDYDAISILRDELNKYGLVLQINVRYGRVFLCVRNTEGHELTFGNDLVYTLTMIRDFDQKEFIKEAVPVEQKRIEEVNDLFFGMKTKEKELLLQLLQESIEKDRSVLNE